MDKEIHTFLKFESKYNCMNGVQNLLITILVSMLATMSQGLPHIYIYIYIHIYTSFFGWSNERKVNVLK